ncbi:transcriptional regulator SyrB protein (plasmid) [Rhizobium etli 8C-3]|uniref:Transcriptional regulator SyrB protein n=1 Tax=Rhizobium etli 8C-3 TaxID=538025 RepID=A0A1L5PA25_RHIET|nr:transposase [Rhizobium etli]APO76954.1 transcriptional regulator SyrB protein [Rhizobium etli 8C-3]
MADENNIGPVAAVETTDAEAKTPAVKKQRSPQRQKTAAEPARAASEVAAAKSPAAKPRTYSEQEKAGKLKLIETEITKGKSTLKDAIKTAGISEQTYYNWKRTATPAVQKNEKAAPAGDELADLVQLEEENEKLRKRLAEKLRAENTVLRKRLGLD